MFSEWNWQSISQLMMQRQGNTKTIWMKKKERGKIHKRNILRFNDNIMQWNENRQN